MMANQGSIPTDKTTLKDRFKKVFTCLILQIGIYHILQKGLGA